MPTLFQHIKCLVGTHNPATIKAPLRSAALASLPCIENAWLLLEGNSIAGFGPMSSMPSGIPQSQCINAAGRFILPAWCDSHTHLVFAEPRETEFIDKIRGLSYAEIAARGGGILSSARKLNALGEDALYQLAAERLSKAALMGTGAMEIKSGYGLTVEGELKMLRVIRRLQKNSPVSIKSTFLGAHAIPAEYRDQREDYIRLIEESMLPQIAAENLADYIDVFCETGFFTPEETVRICAAGKRYGLKPKIHANQLQVSGGVQAGIQSGAVSVDHLESMDEAAISALANSATIGTLLPTAAFFLRMPFQPARLLIDNGCAIALATDFNPGSSPSFNMNLVIAMACIQMRMLPEEAINAATINGAFAMELQHELGSIGIGKMANIFLTKPIPSLAYLPYSFGEQLVEQVWLRGKCISEPSGAIK
ncbi:imidazolonepropionase [Flavihumibacter fluvii]|uniref:imidazolonepropionase n=1 Tax=Flavihumibacter fluvii TaxID=2838157 RepID=UPI001BDDE701|nr:imidazolonepropionase [Flavihumibacter fluvii]ULQ54015.1 imidazolonepropionase [Flavihumibacter fluvii]